MERETGIEPATNGLGSRYSTIELLPLIRPFGRLVAIVAFGELEWRGTQFSMDEVLWLLQRSIMRVRIRRDFLGS